MQLKYIIVRDRDEIESAIIFPEQLTHKDVARIHRATDVRVVSAGFCTLFQAVTAWGRSDSLDMESRDIDAAVIGRDFGYPVVG